MSVQALGWVLDSSEATGSARLVLISIANHVGARGENGYPSMNTIAAEAKVSRNTAIAAVATLERIGELLVYENQGRIGRGGITNRYEMPLVPGWTEPDITVGLPRKRSNEGVQDLDGFGPKGSNLEAEAVQLLTEGVQSANESGPTRCARTVLHPSLLEPERQPSTTPVQRVFDAWKASTKRNGTTVLNDKRKKLIAGALKDYPLEDVIDAVRGWERIAWNRGENPGRKVYNDIELLLRDSAHIERFRDAQRERRHQPAPDSGIGMTEGWTDTLSLVR